ncbi:MAG: NADH dehydrogenase FAD-containing subunit [Marinilabiliales bacterium]|nr:MAG: NADH dehydrogenase FAD-containing subunit [Marinilabiliales bacterium]
MNENFAQELESLKQRVETLEQGNKDQISIVVFSGELDKHLAAFVIATGAAAMGTKAKLFFSFWATAALRDKKKKVKGKNFISKMFGMMLPKGTTKLKLSKMHMMGMGKSMMKGLMKKKNVASLEEMLKTAAENEIEINICEMSMHLMGFTKEEMIDYPHMNICGVASFLEDASESKVQLFI